MPDTLSEKSFLLVYVGTYDCYKNIKIKFSSTINIKMMTLKKSFNYKKKMIVKLNYVL